MTFVDYFEDCVEYPSVAADPFPVNVLWHCVSSTLLNGMINYVDPRTVFLLDRYRSWEETIKGFQYQEPPGSCRWIHSGEIPKKDAFALACQEGRFLHTPLRELGDDILILAKNKEGTQWWHFWYDCDVSDCRIGRFVTTDPDDAVIEKFREHVAHLVDETAGTRHDIYAPRGNLEFISGFHELPTCFLNGWVSF